MQFNYNNPYGHILSHILQIYFLICLYLYDNKGHMQKNAHTLSFIPYSFLFFIGFNSPVIKIYRTYKYGTIKRKPSGSTTPSILFSNGTMPSSTVIPSMLILQIQFYILVPSEVACWHLLQNLLLLR